MLQPTTLAVHSNVPQTDHQSGRCAIGRRHHRTPQVVTAAIAAAVAANALTAGPVIAPGWGYPVFQDNFDGNAVNQGFWQIGDWAASNNGELQYYHPNQTSVSGGVLRLRADYDPAWSFGREYNSGLLRSWQEWSYGRVEVRAKLPYGQGFWPAIWLLPRTAPWPAGGEIDIMEARGDRPYGVSSALHWGWDEPNHQHVANWYENGANFQQGYHDYAVEWDIGTVGFFVDGVEHFRLYEPAVGIPGTPKSIVLNLAVGGNFSGYPDWTTPFPSTFDIDYVRVWQRSAPTPPPTSLIRDPGFEDDAGAMNEWQRFGNVFDNVISDWGTPLDGQRSLKLFGQSTGETNYSGAFQNIAINGGEQLTASAQALTRSEDSIAGSGATASLKIEFYSQPGAAYGSTAFLGEAAVVLADAGLPEDTWSYEQVSAVAPENAVEARVALIFQQPASSPSGAVFIDSVTLNIDCTADLTTNGLANGQPDGLVTLSDFSYYLTLWSQSLTAADVTTDGTSNGIPDGAVTLSDFSYYLSRWSEGCP
ncbi:MAG: glycoside hydrolase family 16 protein [Planctomycetota bacterium]